MRILFPLRRPFGSTSRRDYQSTTRAIDGGGLNDQGCQTFQMNVTGQSFPVEPLSPVKYHIILPKRSKIFRYVSSPWLFKPRLVLTTFPPLHFPRPSLLSRVDYTSCRPKHFISLMILRPFHLPTNVLSMTKIAYDFRRNLHFQYFVFPSTRNPGTVGTPINTVHLLLTPKTQQQ